jgi:hypothetical protein
MTMDCGQNRAWGRHDAPGEKNGGAQSRDISARGTYVLYILAKILPLYQFFIKNLQISFRH